jgi:hypothetical protein
MITIMICRRTNVGAPVASMGTGTIRVMWLYDVTRRRAEQEEDEQEREQERGRVEQNEDENAWSMSTTTSGVNTTALLHVTSTGFAWYRLYPSPSALQPGTGLHYC